MPTIIERNFSGGELAPSLYSRCDTTKYQSGLRTMRNSFVLRQGGSANRSGTKFVRKAVDSSHKVRLIDFVFSDDQALIIEIGHNYINPIFNYTTASDLTLVSAVSKSNPAVVTCAVAPANGTYVYFDNVFGMRQLQGNYYKVAGSAGTSFQLQTVAGVNVDSTSYGTFISGNAYQAQILTSTYNELEIFDIRYVQSADVITFVHPNHKPAEIRRSSGGLFGTWTLTDVSFVPGVNAVDTVFTSAGSSGTDVYWQATAITAKGEESYVAAAPAGANRAATQVNDALVLSRTLSGPGTIAMNGGQTGGGVFNSAQARPITITANGADDYSNQTIKFTGLDKNGNPIVESIAGPNSTTVTTVNSFKRVTQISGSGPMGSSGFVIGVGPTQEIYPNDIGVIDGHNALGVVVSYNYYRSNFLNGPYGYVGNSDVSSGHFLDTGLAPDYTLQPPKSGATFSATGDYPSCVTYYQQKLCLANTNNNPELVELSKTGSFHNFSASAPPQDNDSINFTLAGREVSAVRHMADLGKLILFAQSGEWACLGDASGAITPTVINAKQQSYNGCNNLAPIVIDGSALYTQARGAVVRDFNYTFQVDGYRGNDLTVFSAHLFDGFTLSDWAYQKVPHSIVWAARSDGTLLALTYIQDQQILGWSRHDFENGKAESVACIPATNETALYALVNRTINGSTVRYIEAFATRFISDITDATFLDCSLLYNGTGNLASVTISGGTNYTFDELLTFTTALPSTFSAANVGQEIHLIASDGEPLRLKISQFISATTVKGFASRTVPVASRSVLFPNVSIATSVVSGLEHLEGQNVSVFADGFVVASVHNDQYDILTVTNGSITLPKPFVKIQVGIPITADIETLDVDSAQQETLSDKQKLVTKVSVRVQASRGIFVGNSAPTGTNYLEDLRELKIRSTEGYNDPVRLVTDVVQINIQPEWNSNGRVFIRQVDPLPLTINAIAPAIVLLNGGN